MGSSVRKTTAWEGPRGAIAPLGRLQDSPIRTKVRRNSPRLRHARSLQRAVGHFFDANHVKAVVKEVPAGIRPVIHLLFPTHVGLIRLLGPVR